LCHRRSHSGLLFVAEIEPGLREAALPIGERQVRRFGRATGLLPQEFLFECIQAQQPARESPGEHGGSVRRVRMALEHGESVTHLTGRTQNHQLSVGGRRWNQEDSDETGTDGSRHT
jgi:hypothetical protein